MAFTMGAGGDINVQVNVDADAAAAELGQKFAKAIAEAFKSPAVTNAIQGLSKTFASSTKSFSQQTQSAFKQGTQQGTKFTDSLRQGFRRVGDEARKAFQQSSAEGARGTLRTLERHVQNLGHNFEQLANASSKALRVMEETGRAARGAARSADQAARDAVLSSTQSERVQIANIQRVTTAIAAAARVWSTTFYTFGRIVTSVMRAVENLLRGAWRVGTTAVAGFVRGAGSLIRSLRSTAQTSFRAIGTIIRTTMLAARQAVSAFVRGANALFRTMGRGVAAAMRGVSSAIRSALRRDEGEVRRSMQRREATMRGSAQRQSNILSQVGLGAGLVGAAGIGRFLTGGFRRAGEEESLQLALETILGDAGQATAKLQDISNYARTTAFDFVNLAQSVLQFTAVTGDIDRAEEVTRFLTDLTAVTGGTNAQFQRAALAFQQIISAGRIEGDELRQLTESLPGIPIVDILTEKFYGGDQSAFADARRAGELGAKITAEGFFAALEEGVAERFPEAEGAAIRLAGTLTGLTQNLGENFEIFGAQVIRLVEGPIKSFIGGLNFALDVMGQFVSGTGAIFGGVSDAGVNPFTAAAERDRGAGPTSFTAIPFEELPQEMQDILAERNDWGPNEGFVLAAQHAEELWDQLHPPSELNQRLIQIREIVGNVAKALLGLLGTRIVWQVLAGAVRFLLRPMTLLSLAVGGIVAAFTHFYDISRTFRQTWDDMFAALRPTFEALRGLVGAFVDAFSRTGAGEGGVSLLGRLADAFSIVNVVVHRVLDAIRVFADVLAALLRGRGFSDFFANVQVALAEGIAQLFGEDSDEAFAEAEQRGGSTILNLLENTFLGPVVRFFRGPFLAVLRRIIEGVRGFIGFLRDILGAAFGGQGTEVLDILEGTFVGPVVQFFRGPFADVAEDIGGRVVDFVQGIISFFTEGDFSAMLTNVREFFAPAIETVRDVISGAWEVLEPIVQPLIDEINKIVTAFKEWDFSEFDLGNIAAGAAIGAGIGAFLGGLPGLILGGVAGALSQTGIVSGILESINNAWEQLIKPALDGLWEDIRKHISKVFTAENLGNAGLFILDFIVAAGRAVGNVVSDPRFVAAMAGVAAAALTVVGAFTFGLITGVASNVSDWADIIVAGVEAAINLLPGIDVDVSDFGGFVAGLFDDPVTGALITVSIGLALAPVILGGIAAGISAATKVKGGIATRAAVGLLGVASGIVAEFGRALTTVVRNQSILAPLFARIRNRTPADNAAIDGAARSATTSLANRMYQAVLNPQSGFRNTLRAIGPGVFSIVAGGFAGFAAGRALAGESLLEQLIGVGGLAAGLSLLSLPAGIAAGTLGVLGVVLGNNARDAKEAAARMREMADALRGVGEADIPSVIENLVRTDLLSRSRDDLRDWGDAILEAGFDFEGFAGRLAGGGAQADAEFAEILRGMREDAIATGEITADEFDRILRTITTVAASGQFSDLESLLNGINEALSPEDYFVFNKALEAMDFTGILTGGGDAEDVFNFLQDQVEGTSGALAYLDDQNRIVEGSLRDTAHAADLLREAVSAEGAVTLESIRDILSQGGIETQQKLEALTTVAGELEGAVNEARQAIEDFFEQTFIAPSGEDLLRDFRIRLPEIGREFQQILETDEAGQFVLEPTLSRTDLFEQQVDEVMAEIGRAGKEAFNAGIIFDEASFNQWIADMRAAVAADTTLSDEAKAAITAGLDELDASDVGELFADYAISETELERFRTAGEEIRAAAQEGFTGGGEAGGAGPQGFFSPLAVLSEGDKTAFKESGAELRGELLTGIIEGPGGGGTGEQGVNTFGADLASAIALGMAESDEPAEAAKAIVEQIGEAFSKAVDASGLYGVAVGRGFADGLGSSGQRAVSNARFIASAVAVQFNDLDDQLYNAGVNAGEALARGLISRVRGAAEAAAAVAQAVIRAARSALEIGSPSRVFRNIGLDIGRGFIQGIRDAEGDMSNALETAITKAVEKGTQAARAAVSRARAGQAIFDLLQPSLIPGGTSRTDVRLLRMQQTQAIGEFRSELLSQLPTIQEVRDRQVELFQAQSRQALYDSAREVAFAGRSLVDNLYSLRDEFARARETSAADRTYQQNVLLASGVMTLDARTFAGKQNVEAINQALLNIREFGVEMLNSGYSVDVVVGRLRTLRTNLQSYLRQLGYNSEVVGRLVDQLGLSDAALTQFVRQTAAIGQQSLVTRENLQLFIQAAQGVRQFASEMIGAGVAIPTVVREAKNYRNQLRNQAVALGFNRKQINDLIDELGLSDSALTNFVRQMSAYNKEAERAAKVAKAAADAARRKEDAEKRAVDAEEAAQRRREAAQRRREELDRLARQPLPRSRIDQLHIHLPSGDPEAVALFVANRLAYDDVTSW